MGTETRTALAILSAWARGPVASPAMAAHCPPGLAAARGAGVPMPGAVSGPPGCDEAALLDTGMWDTASAPRSA